MKYIYKNYLILLLISYVYERHYFLQIYYSDYCFVQIEIAIPCDTDHSQDFCDAFTRDIHRQPLHSIFQIKFTLFRNILSRITLQNSKMEHLVIELSWEKEIQP